MVTYFEIDVQINGESPFNMIADFTLLERYDYHHSFEIKAPLDTVESNENQVFTKSKNFLGQGIKIKFIGGTNEHNGQTVHEFNGVVTSVAIARDGGSAAYLMVRGFSPTIILDHGLNTKVYKDKTLSALVDEVGRYPFEGGVRLNVNPSPNPTLHFIHQHKESNYAFLSRLANRYGQWFFFNGQNIIFGKPSSGPSVELKFGSNLIDFEIALALAPTKFKTMAIDEESKALTANTVPVDHLDSLGSFVFDQSEKYFYQEQVYNADSSVTSLSDVQDISKTRRAAIAAGMVRVSGSSVEPKLKVGDTISIEADGASGYGNYTVIIIKHSMSSHGNYVNEFEAISASLGVPLPIGVPSNLVANSNNKK